MRSVAERRDVLLPPAAIPFVGAIYLLVGKQTNSAIRVSDPRASRHRHSHTDLLLYYHRVTK